MQDYGLADNYEIVWVKAQISSSLAAPRSALIRDLDPGPHMGPYGRPLTPRLLGNRFAIVKKLLSLPSLTQKLARTLMMFLSQTHINMQI